ncbi:MAG TPA: magnesium transporter, partial [Balneola sp.]|nr:magnesium transporter [Balneola sp.]
SSGLLLGSILGVLGFATLIAWGLIDGDPLNMELVLKATVVASSLLLIVLFGNVIGAMLPFILSKVGLDPAVSSAPFVATIVDVSGIIIYFSIAVFLLSGILL